MRLQLLIANSLCLLSLPAHAQTVAPAPADTLGMTAALRQLWQASALPGFAVAVIRPDGIAYERGFGYANKARRVPYSPNTLQGVGSVSKTLIGIALLQAVAVGKLRLDNPSTSCCRFRWVILTIRTSRLPSAN